MTTVGIVNRELILNRGGGEINDLSIAAELDQLSFDIEFYTREPLMRAPKYSVERFPIHRIRSPYLYGLSHHFPGIAGSVLRHFDGRLFAESLERTLAGADVDVLQLTGRPTLIDLAHSLKSPLVYSVRGEVSDFYVKKLADADAIVAWGDSYDGIHNRGVDLPEVVRLTPGVDVKSFPRREPGSDPDRDETVFLFVGRFVQLKNVGYLIEEFKRFYETNDGDYRLVLVGDGPLHDRMVEKADNSSVADRIEFTGQVPHEKVTHYYAEADTFILPSTKENYPIVLLEAMASGLPVVAPRVGGIPKIIEHGAHGQLFDSHDQFTLAGELEELLTKFDFDAVADRNRARVEDNYSWRTRAERLGELYETIL